MANSPRTGNAPATVEFRVLTGMNYGPTGKRVEPGDVVNDLPPDDVKWLLTQNHICSLADEVDVEVVIETAPPAVVAPDVVDTDPED